MRASFLSLLMASLVATPILRQKLSVGDMTTTMTAGLPCYFRVRQPGFSLVILLI